METPDEKDIPTLEQYYAMTENEKMKWTCIVCSGPALVGSWEPGRLCRFRCMLIKYE